MGKQSMSPEQDSNEENQETDLNDADHSGQDNDGEDTQTPDNPADPDATNQETGDPSKKDNPTNPNPKQEDPEAGKFSQEAFEKLQKSYAELQPKFTKTSQKVKVLQQFHDENSEIIDALERNPEILEQLLEKEKERNFTKEDAEKIWEKKIKEKEDEENQVKLVQQFASQHKEFEDEEFKRKFIEVFDEVGMTITEKSLLITFDALTKGSAEATAKQSAIAEAKKKQKEKELAQVGGGGSSAQGDSPAQSVFGGSGNANNLL